MITKKLLRVWVIGDSKPYVEIVHFEGEKCVGTKQYRNMTQASWDRTKAFLDDNFGGHFVQGYDNGTVVLWLASKYV